MRLEHPIFKGPLKVELPLEEVDTPTGYAEWREGKDLPKRIKIWRVHSGRYNKMDDYGIVASPLGFEDSPDAERISSGFNSKGPNAVALGRHGNFFQWGFSRDPRDMSESACRVFINLIVYMKQFDGQGILVTKKCGSREWELQRVHFARNAAQGRIEGVSPKVASTMFPDSVWKECGGDLDKIEAYYLKNLEFLREGQDKKRVVDEDLAKLGISNRKPEFLDLLETRLKGTPRDELMLSLSARYLPEGTRCDAEHILSWIKDNREGAFFSDVGGYRWVMNPRTQGSTAPMQELSQPGK
jgi:hypothetical protein